MQCEQLPLTGEQGRVFLLTSPLIGCPGWPQTTSNPHLWNKTCTFGVQSREKTPQIGRSEALSGGVCLLMRSFIVAAIAAVLFIGVDRPCSSQSSSQTKSSQSICVRIELVRDAPGSWSGILAAIQTLDATVISTSTTEYKIGEHLTFGVPVVQGDKLADATIPRLNPRLVHKGTTLTLQTSEVCRQPGHADWIFSCVVLNCTKH